MATLEVTLRLDQPIADRLRADPAERARYEAFLGLVATAETRADIETAVALFTAPAARAGITPEEVEAELATWKREQSAR